MDDKTSITFFVPGKPQGKARARVVRLNNGKVASFTPDNTVLYENYIKMQFAQTDGAREWRMCYRSSPLALDLTACFPIPKSTSNVQRKAMQEGILQPTKKPDIDNILKVVCDALNGCAYDDDVQVVTVTARKIYAEDAGLKITIKELKEE